MILGRPNPGRPAQPRIQTQYIHKPQTHVFTRPNYPNRQGNIKGHKFVSGNGVLPQRRAHLLEPYHAHGSYGDRLRVDTQTQGNYGYHTTTQVHYQNGEHSLEHGHQSHAPAHGVHDQSAQSLAKHITNLLEHGPQNHPITIDAATARVIISYLKDLEHGTPTEPVMIPNEEYEHKIQNLNERIHNLENQINHMEQERAHLLHQGHVAEAQVIEHQEHEMEHKIDELALEIDKAEDVHLREEIQEIEAQTHALESEGGHDIELAALETQKANLEVQDALVDQQIKELEIANVAHDIAELEKREAEVAHTTHDQAEIQHIENEIAHLEQEKHAIEADNQIITELNQDIAVDEQKIEKLSQEPGHTDQVIALIRAKRKLKRTVRKLQDESTNNGEEGEGADDNGATVETTTVIEEDTITTEEPGSDEVTVQEPRTCDNLADLEGHYEYLVKELRDLYPNPADAGLSLSDVQEAFNARLEDQNTHHIEAINCITKYAGLLRTEDLQNLIGAEEKHRGSLFDDIQANMHIALNQRIEEIVNTELDSNLLKKVDTIGVEAGHFEIVKGEGDEDIVKPVDHAIDIIAELEEAKNALVKANDDVEVLLKVEESENHGEGGDGSGVTGSEEVVGDRRLRRGFIRNKIGYNRYRRYKRY